MSNLETCKVDNFNTKVGKQAEKAITAFQDVIHKFCDNVYGTSKNNNLFTIRRTLENATLRYKEHPNYSNHVLQDYRQCIRDIEDNMYRDVLVIHTMSLDEVTDILNRFIFVISNDMGMSTDTSDEVKAKEWKDCILAIYDILEDPYRIMLKNLGMINHFLKVLTLEEESEKE